MREVFLGRLRGLHLMRTFLLACAALVAWMPPAEAQVVVAPGAGMPPLVRVMHADGTEQSFFAYDPAFGGGVRVALGDVNGDGVLDIITGAGPGGGPHVRVFSGTDFTPLASFFAYTPVFVGGVYVAAGDVNGDGKADIITGPGEGGGPHVRVFSGADLSELAGFMAYSPVFVGGVYVAAGDVNGDGRADIITGAGPGGGPHVRVFSGADLSGLASFFAYSPFFVGGVSVASADVDGDGSADIITGAGPGGGPHVRVFSGTDLAELRSFMAYDMSFVGGVFVGANDFDGDGTVEIITGPGPGGGPHVKVFNAADLAVIAQGMVFESGFAGGVFIGSIAGGAGGVRITSATATSFPIGSPSTFTVTTAGGAGPITLASTGTLPGGVTFTDNGDGTATLAGTPDAGTAGAYPLTFTASDGVGAPATQSFTLTVTQGPAITSANAATFNVGFPGTFTVTTTGSPAPAITATGALPAGVTFVDNGNGTATLAGTPGAGTAGTYPLTIGAANGVGAPATQAFTLTISEGPVFTSPASTTFTVGVAGTFAVTTSGSPTPTLSVTGTLPSGVTFTDNGTGSGTLAGTPDAGTAGTHTFTITATNTAGTTPQSFTLTVQEGPAITSAAATTFTVGSAGTFTVTTTGFPAPSIAVGGATLPAGVTFVDNGNGTGTLSGTPDAGTGGLYNITFTATNAAGSSPSQAFTLTVNQAPAITSANATTFTVGVAGSFVVTTTGFPTPAIVQGGALPAGVTFTPSTGVLAGTPDPGTGGTYAITFTAANGITPDAVQSFTLTVNQAPAITSANSTTFTIGAPGSFTVTTTGFPAPTIVRSGALPAGVAFVDNGNGTGTLSGTPDPGTAGSYPITFTAANSVLPDAVQSFTLTVNQLPVLTIADVSQAEGNAGTTTFTFTVSLSEPAQPGGVTFDIATADGTATAASGDYVAQTLTGQTIPAGNSTYTFNVTVNGDTTAEGNETFLVNVTTVTGAVVGDGTATGTITNDDDPAPVITSANATTFTVGVAGSFTVTATGFPLPSLTLGGVTLPAGVTFVDNGNGTGTLSGTPDPGTGGTYLITFTAANGVPPDAVQNFTLTVNQAPAITSANATTFTVGVGGSFTVTTTGFPLAAITRTGAALPANLTFTDNGNGTGTLSGTPAALTGGVYTFTFTAANGVTPDAVQSFTLTVNQAPVITSANATSFTVGVAGSFTVTTTGFPAPAITIGGATLPSGVTFVDNGTGTGTLSGTPDPGTGGTYNITFTASSAAGTSPVQNFTLTVIDPIVFTSANATTFTEGILGTFAVTTTGSPTPTLTFTGTLPDGVTFTDNGNGTATLAGNATLGGTFPLVFTATNVNGPVTQNFTLTVIEVNDAPSFVLAGNPPAVNEDAGPQSVATFATSISAGPPNEAGQLLTFEVTANTNTGLFTTQPAVSATGTLTYTSAPNAFGTATVTIQLRDNGGTANGGIDVSAPQQFTITVNPVNDPPIVAPETFDVLGNTELRVDMTAGTTPHTPETTPNPNPVKGVLDNDGDPEGDPFTVTAITGCADATAPFDCTLPDGAVIHVEATGEFSFTPGPGDTTASFTYTVTDTPAFGLPASVPGTVTFTIAEMVWYVKNDAAAGGTGTSIAPLNALTTLNGAGGAGDVDDGNDYIFVDFGDGTSTGQTGGLELEAGQHLLGEFMGLSIPVNLNGNGSPTVLVPTPAGDACGGGPCRPLVSNTTGNAVTITEAMVAEVRGFRLAGGSAGNAIDVTTDAALTGSPSLLISANVFQGAGQEGLDFTMNTGTTGTLTLAVTANSWNTAGTHAGFAVDINRVAGTGTLNLDFSGNTDIISTGVGAVVINGGTGGAASTFITGFANNSVHGNTAGGGIGIMNATFDATPGGGINQVNAGTLAIGASGNPVGIAGVSIGSAGNPVLGSVSFTDLDVFATTFGLMANGNGGSLSLAVAPGVGTISAAGGAAVDVTAAAIDLQLSSLTSTVSAGSGVTLTAVSGTFSAPAGSTITKNGGSGAAFSVNNIAAGTTVLSSTYGGTINNTSGTGGSVLVNNADSGSALSFTGAITDNPGTGISLASNTGAAVGFSGGLTLNGTASVFTAIGGGTVTVTGTNTIGATTAATTTALNITNTTIGASGLTFRTIASNGAASGVVLNTTGAGAFTVSGNGAAGTGGTINTSTGPGMSLTSTGAVSLSFMNIQNGGDDGIRGNGVVGFNLTSVNITGNGNAVGERGIDMLELTGSGSMTNTTVSGSAEHNVRIANTTGTLTAFNVTGSTFSLPNFTTGDDGLLVEQNGTGTMNLNITGNTFTDNKGDHFQVASQASAAGAINFTFNNNTLTTTAIHDDGLGTDDVIGGGITISPSGSTDVTFTISGNNIQQAFDDALNLNLGTASTAAASLVGTISNNTIGTAGQVDSGSESSNTITITSNGAGSTTVAVTNNVLRQYGNGHGILIDNKEGSATVNATVTGNNIDNPGTFAINGIHVSAGATAGPPADSGTTCAALTGNTVTNAGLATADIRLRQRFSTTIRLPGYAGAADDTTAVNAFVAGNNGGAEVTSIHNVGGGGNGYLGGATCTLPQ